MLGAIFLASAMQAQGSKGDSIPALEATVPSGGIEILFQILTYRKDKGSWPTSEIIKPVGSVESVALEQTGEELRIRLAMHDRRVVLRMKPDGSFVATPPLSSFINAASAVLEESNKGSPMPPIIIPPKIK
jgi:hypothetical protein